MDVEVQAISEEFARLFASQKSIPENSESSPAEEAPWPPSSQTHHVQLEETMYDVQEQSILQHQIENNFRLQENKSNYLVAAETTSYIVVVSGCATSTRQVSPEPACGCE